MATLVAVQFMYVLNNKRGCESVSVTDKKATIIHEYEEVKKIPSDFRYTEYVDTYDCYMIKLGLDPERIEDRYNEALIYNLQQNKDKYQGVMEITLQHNLTDVAEYSVANFDKMFNDFLYRDEKVRKIGIKRVNEEPVFLLKIRDTDTLPEYLTVPADVNDADSLRTMRHEWFVKTVYIYEHKLEEQTKELLNIAESKLSPKQEKYNYVKEFKKKANMLNVLQNEQMEGFDFRQISLAGTVFINCNLKNANFSYVNLEEVTFVHCNLEGAIFYGAQLNGCNQYNCEPIKVVDIYKSYA